jgi:phage shock protein A
MALINRVARLFRADFHAVLDHIEEPEQMLRQAIRDMEDELAVIEQRLSATLLEQGTLEQQEKELRASLDELGDKLDFCFDTGKDELAKRLVRSKLEAELALKHIRAKSASSDDYIAEQQKRLEEGRRQLDSLRQKAEIVATNRKVGARGQAHAPPRNESSISDADVEIAFLREKSARSAL